MTWKAYYMTYRALTPTLFGGRLFGFIQTTRPYAAGSALWGSITASLTRAVFDRADGQIYRQVGEFVAHNLLTSYGAIVLGKETNDTALPYFYNGQWYMGYPRKRENGLTMSAFESRFIASLGKTAIAPSGRVAEDQTLHETEAISNYDHQKKVPVEWRFILYVRQPYETDIPELSDLSVNALFSILDTMTIGADRSTGLGLWKRMPSMPASSTVDNVRQISGLPVPLDWDEEEKVLRAHAVYNEKDRIKMKGRLEPVPWRHWENRATTAWGAGQSLSVKPMYLPGCRLLSPCTPVISPFGLWQFMKEEDDG